MKEQERELTHRIMLSPEENREYNAHTNGKLANTLSGKFDTSYVEFC